MAELAGFTTQIKISGAPIAMAGETTVTDDNTVYQIESASKQVLDRDTSPTVLDGGVETLEKYTVNYLNGKITFGSANAGRVITVTGKYLPMTVAAYANQASKSDNCDIIDCTPFGATYKKRVKGLKSASGSLTQLNLADDTFKDALTAGVPIVLEYRATPESEPDRYWALLESDEVTAAIEGLQSEAVSWISHDAWIKLGK